MKTLRKMAFIASFATVAGVLSSCTNEGYESLRQPGPASSLIAKSPEFNAYSGNHTWKMSKYSTRSNAGDGYIGNATWDQFQDPQNITPEEKADVLKALEAKVTGSRISEEIVFPWENYFLQDVVSAVETDTPSKSYTFEAWNKGADCSPYSHHGDDFANYEEVANSGQITKYRQTKDPVTNTETRIDKTALMTDMNIGGSYEEMYDQLVGKQFRWYINCHENLHWSEYIVVEVDGSYYICFDFACGHAENDVDGHPGRGNTQNDWDYNDWIIKISPALPKNFDNSVDQYPGIWRRVLSGGSGEVQPGEGDNNGNGENSGGDENNGNDKPGATPSIPSKWDPHVEVNLSVNDALENGDYISSHLSVHVRALTDVEVFIPVPAVYYCAADDMEIVLSHKEELFAYGKENHTVTYEVAGQQVGLTVSYEPEGIRVTTSGINEKVIDYCQQNFGDGITFEVWSYYNDNSTRELLKGYFDNSLVSFTRSENVKYFVNAINKLGDNPNEWDCTVDIVDRQKSEFDDRRQGNHFNGSPYNWIYPKLEN